MKQSSIISIIWCVGFSVTSFAKVCEKLAMVKGFTAAATVSKAWHHRCCTVGRVLLYRQKSKCRTRYVFFFLAVDAKCTKFLHGFPNERRGGNARNNFQKLYIGCFTIFSTCIFFMIRNLPGPR